MSLSDQHKESRAQSRKEARAIRAYLQAIESDKRGRMSELGHAQDMNTLIAGFIEYAASYSERKGISHAAWREFGVPAETLREAGIVETLRR